MLSGDPSPAEAASGPAPGPPVAAPERGRIRDRHVCQKCRKELLVSYEGQPDEPKEAAPVACPHCWAVMHLQIGTWAAVGGDYSAEKA